MELAESTATELATSALRRATRSLRDRMTRPQDTFDIAGHKIRRGDRLQFELPMAQLYTQTPLHLPVEVIHGRTEGPTLLVCAGVHGDELNGIEVIRRLRTLPALERLRGTLVLVPVVNLFGFLHQTRYLPDRRDLNRCFPGSETGSLAARTANLFFDAVVMRCTHVIDLHTGALHRENLPQIRASLDQKEVDRMARGFSIPVIINSGLLDGSLRAEAGKHDIAVITYEAGEALRVGEKDVVTGVRGVVSVMRTLGMLGGRRPGAKRASPHVANATKWFRSPTDGMFRPLAKLGTHVRLGDTLGVVSAPFSSDDTVLSAPFEGILICVNRLPLVNEGDALFHIARFGEVATVGEEITSHGYRVEGDPLFEVEAINETDGDES